MSYSFKLTGNQINMKRFNALYLELNQFLQAGNMVKVIFISFVSLQKT